MQQPRHFTPHVESHLPELQLYALTAGGRQLDATSISMAKIYIDFEAKRIAILERANRILVEQELAPLPV